LEVLDKFVEAQAETMAFIKADFGIGPGSHAVNLPL
jgi:hypothetical protein